MSLVTCKSYEQSMDAILDTSQCQKIVDMSLTTDNSHKLCVDTSIVMNTLNKLSDDMSLVIDI